MWETCAGAGRPAAGMPGVIRLTEEENAAVLDPENPDGQSGCPNLIASGEFVQPLDRVTKEGDHLSKPWHGFWLVGREQSE